LDKDYYSRELAYQSVIDGKNNLNLLTEKVIVQSNDTFVSIRIPAEAVANISEGKIRFIRSSDATKDVEIPLMVSENNTQNIPISKFIKGIYRLQLSWKSMDKNYYYEKDVYI
ncbi:MAG TPA: FixH family protein, partial [Chitinophagales bacterium]|nr:FixH family protein [Chitinophagales bacterium]